MHAFLLILLVLPCGAVARADSRPFVPHVVPVGDPSVSYANFELTDGGRYMVWFQMEPDGRGEGTVWHCAVNPDTGELIPRDGKGFRAFESSVWGRANPGVDAQGIYYVGLDRSGRLVMVRPSGASSGDVSVLPTPADITRRAIYPTTMADRRGGYVYWIKNERQAGGGMNRRNRWFELQVISLDDPEHVRVVTRQDKPWRGFAPMDVGFARWMGGRPILTYGAKDADGKVQVMAYNADRPQGGSVQLTDDPHSKIDPYSWTFQGKEILMPGIDGQAEGQIFVRAPGASRFHVEETITPPGSQLENPGLAQSFEPIVVDGKAYAVYQVNNRPRLGSFWSVTFGQPGELWLTTLLQAPRQQWRLTPDAATPVAEPEPYEGNHKVWVFYNVTPQGGGMAGLIRGVWRLYRADTPLEK